MIIRLDVASSMLVIKSDLALANFAFELDQVKPSGRSANDSCLITGKP